MFRLLGLRVAVLLAQAAVALARDIDRQGDLELVDDPVARIVAYAAERAVGHVVERTVLVAERDGAEGDLLDRALGVAARLDIVADAEDVLDEIAGAAEEVFHQRLCTETDGDADDAGRGEERGDADAEGGERAHQRHGADHQPTDAAQQRLHRAGSTLHAAALAREMDGKPGLEKPPG